MIIDKLNEMWEKDSKIDGSDLGSASRNIPQLHAKYLKILTDERRKLRERKQEYSTLRSLKTEYFSGRMSVDQLKELGWKPFPLKVMKADIDRHMSSDKDIQDMFSKQDDQQILVDTLEEVINSINRRSFYISSALEWHKFVNGIS